jgi:hypothetical protein
MTKPQCATKSPALNHGISCYRTGPNTTSANSRCVVPSANTGAILCIISGIIIISATMLQNGECHEPCQRRPCDCPERQK